MDVELVTLRNLYLPKTCQWRFKGRIAEEPLHYSLVQQTANQSGNEHSMAVAGKTAAGLRVSRLGLERRAEHWSFQNRFPAFRVTR
jgi:hypothetical protein